MTAPTEKSSLYLFGSSSEERSRRAYLLVWEESSVQESVVLAGGVEDKGMDLSEKELMEVVRKKNTKVGFVVKVGVIDLVRLKRG